MSPLSILLSFLRWDPERQISCLSGLAHDNGSPEFTFVTTNPVLRLAKITHDLHFQREGESRAAWRERQGIGKSVDLNLLREVDEALEGLHAVFDLMRCSSKESLLTAHGMRKAAAWRLVRKIARHGEEALALTTKPSETDVLTLLGSSEFQ